MTMTYLAALDVGASEIKAVIFDTSGVVVGQARRDCPTESPSPGWAEVPGEVLLRWPLEVLREAVHRSEVNLDAVRAVGVTGSRATILPVDVQGRGVGPAILWYDRRASDAVDELNERLGAGRFSDLTGVPLDPTPSVTKMLWLRRERPDIFSSAHVFILPQTAALHALTGIGWYCDHSYGSYLGLMDLKTTRWSRTLLDAAELQEDVLPELVIPGAVVGTLSPSAAEAAGLNAGIKVVASGSDAACFKLGVGLGREGVACVYLGTAGAAGMITDRPIRDHRLTCCPAALPGHWDADALLLTGGSAYRWVRDLLTGLSDSQPKVSFGALDAIAARAPAGSDGVIVVPNFAGAGTPLWDPNASGIISGLRLSHGPAHLARAVLEGLVCSQRHALEVLQEVVSPITSLQFTGGGAASKLWAQILADLTGYPVAVPSSQESTSLGAAMMAGVAVGVFADYAEAVGAMNTAEDRYEPDSASHDLYEGTYRAYRNVLRRMCDTREGGEN